MAPLERPRDPGGSTPELEKLKRRLSHGKETVYENTPAKAACDVHCDVPSSPKGGSPKDKARDVQFPFPFDEIHRYFPTAHERLNDFLPAEVTDVLVRLHDKLPEHLQLDLGALSRRPEKRERRELFPEKRRVQRVNAWLWGALALALVYIVHLQRQLGAVAPCSCPVQPAPTARSPYRAVPAVPTAYAARPAPMMTNTSLVTTLQVELETKSWQHSECMSEFQTHLETMLHQFRLDRADLEQGVKFADTTPMHLILYAGAVEARLQYMGIHDPQS